MVRPDLLFLSTVALSDEAEAAVWAIKGPTVPENVADEVSTVREETPDAAGKTP